MAKNFVDMVAMVYNNEKKLVASVTIWEHDVRTETIEVPDLPELEEETLYDILIPMSPLPYTCRGKVFIRNGHKYIALCRIKETEKRHATRYTVDFPGEIENLICDGETYAMHRFVEVQLTNLSKSGIRFKAKYNALLTGDSFNIRLKIGNGHDKLLKAHVVYRIDTERESSEFGCRLLAKSEC